MPRKPSPSERLAELMELRRTELGMEWLDVAKRGNISTEAIRQARKGKTIRPLTQAAIERGLGWRQGSYQAVLAGGDPVPVDDSTRVSHRSDGIHASGSNSVKAVLDAIDDDPMLLPEAKEHLKNQYGLLLRLNAASAAAAAVDAFDEQLERRVASREAEIRAQKGLTVGQKETLIDAMAAEERQRARNAPSQDGWRNPHLDVRFEESDDDSPLSEDEAAAALAEESSREPDPERR